MDRTRLYLTFGVTSIALQAWAWWLVASGRPCPRLAFMLGPFGLYFLFMSLHPDFRRPVEERTAARQQTMLGVITACAILAFWNYRLMHG